MRDARLKAAQRICHRCASGKKVSKHELAYSFAVAELYGDDAVWQQGCGNKEVK